MQLIAINAADSQVRWLLDQYSVPVRPLTGALVGSGESYYTPSYIVARDSLIFVLDRGSEKYFSVVSKSTGRVLSRFGAKGDGPGEFRGPFSLHIDTKDPDKLWVFDLNLRRLTSVNLGGIPLRAGFPKFASTTINLPLFDILPMSSGSLLGTTLSQDGERFVQLRADGSVERKIGRTLPPPSNIPMSVWQNAQRVHMARSPDGSKFVAASRYADRIEIYNASGQLLATCQRHFGFDPVFSKEAFVVGAGKNGPIMGAGPDSRWAYVSVATSTRRIYAIFSGKTSRGFRSSQSMGHVLHVFDWTGRSVGVFTLDNTVVSIAVEPDDSQLYAVRHDPEPAIVKYNLLSIR
jgi:hypothetical protein